LPRPLEESPARGSTASLAYACELIQHKKYQDAQSILRKLIATDPGNAALRFAAGYVDQQQENWDEALDSYQKSLALVPGLSDTHSRLSYLFYRDDDGDNAIAEGPHRPQYRSRQCRTDRFVGLGLYANNQFAAAAHAFRNRWLASLNADVYYDMGITLRDQGEVDAAAAAKLSG